MNLPLLEGPVKVPDNLNTVGKAKFKEVTDLLIEMQVISHIDLDLIMILCIEYETYYESNRLLLKKLTVNKGSGDLAINPMKQVRDKALRNILDLCRALYLTPPLRQQLKLDGSEDKLKDPMANLMNKR